MKKLENKQTKLPKEEGFVTYAELAMNVINVPPKEGFDLNEMSMRLKMRAKLEDANGKIEFEDTEAEKLKELVAGFKWAVLHADLLAFGEAVKNM